MAYAARASKPTGAGMVVIPDVRGLHVYYKELADRFAEVGVQTAIGGLATVELIKPIESIGKNVIPQIAKL